MGNFPPKPSPGQKQKYTKTEIQKHKTKQRRKKEQHGSCARRDSAAQEGIEAQARLRAAEDSWAEEALQHKQAMQQLKASLAKTTDEAEATKTQLREDIEGLQSRAEELQLRLDSLDLMHTSAVDANKELGAARALLQQQAAEASKEHHDALVRLKQQHQHSLDTAVDDLGKRHRAVLLESEQVHCRARVLPRRCQP